MVSILTPFASTRDAAALFDADGRLAVYRPWCPEGSIWHSVNNILIGVADKISRSGIPPTFKNGMRGEFSTFAFSLHRGSQAVRLSLLHALILILIHYR